MIEEEGITAPSKQQALLPLPTYGFIAQPPFRIQPLNNSPSSADQLASVFPIRREKKCVFPGLAISVRRGHTAPLSPAACHQTHAPHLRLGSTAYSGPSETGDYASEKHHASCCHLEPGASENNIWLS